ncbi:DUF4435 domain-containing protein [Pectobacterium wasabiae]|uniref:DUF4435 domain-containing protein n=1 Tax=Pectobacterium wasabiae TaxID=55208 RepID=A0AAW3EGU6_9GAMM|nr:DUF4435 domain-containing protein [Pectobacterium wasabiae]AOR61733.1 hypothetical protein A7983_00245 [Pectobacterium wasabiae CFBP 3304]EJS93193.1 Hypothetical protein Y17_3602 [Pectobacterium wasabiae CFBP 3304]KFX08019.1 hypothetical protein JV38_08890 [Pectobacterium wasabiae]KGA30654.1 hypothetical protein KU73_01735 [Pectobacterium wasabiae]
MAKIDKVIQDIKDRDLAAFPNKRVLILEGADDVAAFQQLLTKYNASWEQQWVLVKANKKQNVLDILALENTWYGLIDRDEWSEDKITQLEQEHPRLMFLPRFCIESYLVNPSEIWQALRPKHQMRIAGGEAAFTRKFEQEVHRWFNHAAIWYVVNPLWERLRAAGFNSALLDVDTVRQDAEVERILRSWGTLINPENLAQEILQRKAQVESLSLSEQLTICIHGKLFFEKFVDPLLTSLLGQRGREQRQKDLFSTLPIPDDLSPIWVRMGL